jgi:hypothetical protein
LSFVGRSRSISLAGSDGWRAKRNRHRGSAMPAEYMPEHYAASHGEGSKVTGDFPAVPAHNSVICRRPLARVLKDGRQRDLACGRPSRRAQERAPLDEAGE